MVSPLGPNGVATIEHSTFSGIPRETHGGSLGVGYFFSRTLHAALEGAPSDFGSTMHLVA